MTKNRRKPRRNEPVNFWRSYVVKFGSKLLLAVAVIVIVLTIAQCTIEKPESPTWETRLVVPLINRTYDMPEIIERIDQDEIYIDSAGNPAFSLESELDTVTISQSDLTIDPLADSLADSIGLVRITAPSVPPLSYPLDTLAAGLGLSMVGQNLVIPNNTQLDADQTLVLSSFEWADIASGTIRIQLNNSTGINLKNVAVHLINNETPASPDTFVLATYGSMTAGAVNALDHALNGNRISKDLVVAVVAQANGDQQVDPTGRFVGANVSFPGAVTVSSAEAVIPAQPDYDFSRTIPLDLDPGESIDSAVLESGSLSLSIYNSTSLSATVQIDAPGLRSGSAYTVTRVVPPFQSVLVNDNLAGYTLVPTANAVSLQASATVPGSGGSTAVVDQYDNFRVVASIGNLNFAQVTGVFTDAEADFSGIHEDLDIPDGFDNIEIIDATIVLEVYNGVDLPGQLSITIDGSNGEQLVVVDSVAPRGQDSVLLTTIVIDSIGDFLSPLPESIDITGTASFGQAGYHGTITPNDFVFARVTIYSPINVRITEAEVTDLDIEAENIDQEDIDAITEHVENARLVYTIINHLPLGVTAYVNVGGDRTLVETAPEFVSDTFRADAAPVSLITGIATADTTSIGELVLTNDDVQVLNNDSIFILPRVFLNGSDPNGVQLTNGDYITLQGRIEVVYRFDGEF